MRLQELAIGSEGPQSVSDVGVWCLVSGVLSGV